MQERSAIRIGLDRVSAVALAAAMAAFASPAAAVPTTVLFDFNADGTLPNCACAGATNKTIASYMTQVLVAQGFKNVFVYQSGGIGQMGLPANSTSNGLSYNGDGHVIDDPNGARPVTLADSEHYVTGTTSQATYTAYGNGSGYDNGANDTAPNPDTVFGNGSAIPAGNQSALNDGYVKNCTGTDSSCAATGFAIADSAGNVTSYTYGSSPPFTPPHAMGAGTSDHVLLGIGTYDTTYANNFGNYLKDAYGNRYQIESIDFDYQLFPDGTCSDNKTGTIGSPASDWCGGAGHPNLPDLTVYAGMNGAGGIQLPAPQPAGGFTAADSSPGTRSPASSSEQSPQGLGVVGYNGVPTLSSLAAIGTSNANVFDFVDWPATIAFDNFKIHTKDLPEPGTLILFGFGLLGLAGIARRRRTKPVV